MADTTNATEEESEPRGLLCRRCHCAHSRVLATRRRERYLMRKRECRHCLYRWTTWERSIGEPTTGRGGA